MKDSQMQYFKKAMNKKPGSRINSENLVSFDNWVVKSFALIFALTFLLKGVITYWSYPYFDFPSFYYGVWSTFVDHISPYNYQHLQTYSRSPTGLIFPYVYPPYSLPLFSPIVLIPYGVASRALLIFNCISPFLLCWFLLKRIIPNVHPLLYYCGTAIFILSAPTTITILAGQINFIVFSFVLLFWYFIKSGPGYWRSSLSLVIAVGFKTYPALLLLNVLSAKRYKVFIATIVSLFSLSLLSFWIAPSGTWGAWYQEVFPSGGYGVVPTHLFSPDHPENQSLNGFWYRMTGSLELGKMLTFINVLLLLSLILFVFRKLGEEAADIDLNMSASLLFLQLVAPYSWQHHMVFSLLGIITGIHYAISYRRRIMIFILSLNTVLIASEFPLDLPWFQTSRLLSLLIYVKLYAVIISLGAVCWLKIYRIELLETDRGE